MKAPRGAAVTLVHECAIVCPAGFLGRRVKSNVANVDTRPDPYQEALNAVVEVLVVDGVLIVPHAVVWSRHLAADKENSIVSRIRLVLSHRCARSCPSHEGRLHSDGGTECRKIEKCRATAD